VTDEQRLALRQAVTFAVGCAGGSPDVRVWPRLFCSPPPTQVVVGLGAAGPDGEGLPPPRPLTPTQLLGLAALLEDDTFIPNALADFMLDKGYDYAVAVAEKARKEERECIAERLYGESSRARNGDGEVNARLSRALSSIADDLVFGVPATVPQATG